MSLTATLLGAARFPGAMTKNTTDTLASQSLSANRTTLICIGNVPTTVETPTVPTAEDTGSRIYYQVATVNAPAGDGRSTIHRAYATAAATLDLKIREPATGSTNGSGATKWLAIEIAGSTSSPVAGTATFGAGAGSTTITINTTSGGANLPSPESSVTPLVFITSRTYGGTIAMDAPTGWTKVGDNLTQDGTTSLHIAAFVKNSALSAGDTINQAFTVSNFGSPLYNTVCAGVSAVLALLRGANLRLRVPITDWSAGSSPLGATGTVGYVWKHEPSDEPGVKYTGFSIVSDGSGGARADLDVTGKLGFAAGDTGYLLINDAVEAASPNNHATSGGLLSGTVAEGSGDPPA